MASVHTKRHILGRVQGRTAWKSAHGPRGPVPSFAPHRAVPRRAPAVTHSEAGQRRQHVATGLPHVPLPPDSNPGYRKYAPDGSIPGPIVVRPKPAVMPAPHGDPRAAADVASTGASRSSVNSRKWEPLRSTRGEYL